MQFGTPSAAFPESQADSDEVWVRTFNKESTFVRIAPTKRVHEGRELEGTDAWVKELEHYDRKGFGRSFPCPVPYGYPKDNCPGCTHDDEDVRKRSAKWFFNALDDKGYLRVYKIGVKLLRKFKLREQRLGTVSDRDYEVIRSGKDFNEIEYDLEAGEKEKREFPEEMHDIGEILGRNFQEALDYYSGKARKDKADETDSDAEEDAPLREDAGKSKLSEKLEADRAERAKGKEKDAEPEADESDDEAWKSWGKNPDEDTLKEAETSDLKGWLTSQKVEFPARAPRSRIIALAKEQALKPPF